MKNAGAEGSMDQLRARAYLHLLAGNDLGSLLTQPTASTMDNRTPGTPGAGTPARQAPAAPAPPVVTRAAHGMARLAARVRPG